MVGKEIRENKESAKEAVYLVKVYGPRDEELFINYRPGYKRVEAEVKEDGWLGVVVGWAEMMIEKYRGLSVMVGGIINGKAKRGYHHAG